MLCFQRDRAVSIPASALARTRGSPVLRAHRALSEPFARWSDDNLYELAPGGDFEGSLGGWVLQGGAQRVSGSEPFGVTGKVGSYSLQATPRRGRGLAVDLHQRRLPGVPSVHEDEHAGHEAERLRRLSDGQERGHDGVAVLSPGSTWQPTSPISTGWMLGQLLDGPTANLSLEFATTQGSAQIDDVFIDPHGRCC